MTDDNSEVSRSTPELAAEVSSLRREVETLEAALKKPDKPFYRDGSLILAAIAFVFSLYTYYRQDRNDTQVELRNVLKDLYALPEEDADSRQKFKGTADEARISVALNHQYEVLSLQAYALAQHLGRRLDLPERLAVANAIMGYEPRLAESMLTSAQIPADDIEDLVAVRQGLGSLQILSGRSEQGDKAFQSANDLLKSPEMNLNGKVTAAFNQLRWAESYLGVGNCDNAAAHLKAVQDVVQQLAGTPAAEMIQPPLNVDLKTEAFCADAAAAH